MRPINKKFREILERQVSTPVLVLKVPSQTEIAKEFGVSRVTFNAWLRGDYAISRKTLEESGTLERLDWVGELARNLMSVIKEDEAHKDELRRLKNKRLMSITNLNKDYVVRRKRRVSKHGSSIYVCISDNKYAVIPSIGDYYITEIENRLVTGVRDTWQVEQACINWCIKEGVPCNVEKKTVFGTVMNQ